MNELEKSRYLQKTEFLRFWECILAGIGVEDP